MKLSPRPLLASICLMSAVAQAGATGTLDQQQLVYNGGMSARTLAGYSTWQSFTAGLSGTLTEIDMAFFTAMSGTALMQVRSGAGTQGAVLQTQTIAVTSANALTWDAWAVSVPVTTGAQYTFQITPNAANLPDPYGVALASGNLYSGGILGIDDPSGTYPTNFDAVFKTYVTAVPEPGSAVLLAAGLLFAASRVRGRRRSS